MAQHFQFTVDSLAGDEILEDIWHFLEGDPLAVTGICDRPATPTRKYKLKGNKRRHWGGVG